MANLVQPNELDAAAVDARQVRLVTTGRCKRPLPLFV